MIWITGIAGLLAGAVVGALLFKLLKSDEAKVRELERKLQALSEEHESYKNSVHTHFNGTARLLNEMTDSYRNVYQHLAQGASNLCPDYIASQLQLQNSNSSALLSAAPQAPDISTTSEPDIPDPPLDYATRNSDGADKKGALEEDYGIPKPGHRD